MNNLPKDIENIILDYKEQLEIAEKYQNLLNQMKRDVYIWNFGNLFTMRTMGNYEIFYYYSEFLFLIITIKNIYKNESYF